MALTDKYDFENLKNETENLILNELEKQLNAYKEPLCLCNDCVVDMAALALNTAKPLYRSSLMGKFYADTLMDQKSYAANIRTSVRRAIEKIRKNPAHDTVQEETT